MFADIEIAHDIDQNYDINDKLADSSREEIFRRGGVSGFCPCQSLTGSLIKIQASSLAVACILHSYWLT